MSFYKPEVCERGNEGRSLAELVQYLYTFGVDENDYSKPIVVLGSVNVAKYNYRGGVLSNWILPHQYDYKAFTDYLTYEIKMKSIWEVK
ncbi:hypothetical protein [Arcticibacterium luteifluviistationis]|uniref:Uncharacterized protein n=1 Tax=Arcticibacterium luteifluviistationis TaxID=1784714 RepID=A0A2Z4GB19_9BACT|nr:hypothetical protein [Arcticibacterium luteifluviistationis]AWV98265.1 hypothetical protein DJ013_08820 [Arcticibacterium luteifluviistationis]